MKKQSVIQYILGFILVLTVTFLVLGQNYLGKNLIYSVRTSQKIVALTFDDGPHPVYTSKLLDILHQYHAKATFFMIGNSMRQYPFIVKRIVTEGHSIGNHTYTHPRNMAICSKAQIIKEINDCESVIRQLTGRRSFIFRPPRGLFNYKVVRIANIKKYRMILWSVCGNNKQVDDPELMAKRVIGKIHPGNIILLHDGTYDFRWKDVEATQFIIRALLKKGYRFVTIPQLLESPKHTGS